MSDFCSFYSFLSSLIFLGFIWIVFIIRKNNKSISILKKANKPLFQICRQQTAGEWGQSFYYKGSENSYMAQACLQ